MKPLILFLIFILTNMCCAGTSGGESIHSRISSNIGWIKDNIKLKKHKESNSIIQPAA